MYSIGDHIKRPFIEAVKAEKGGSITIEAAFVMPIVIFAIVALIYLSFCLHDRCLLQGAVDQTLQKAELGVKHEEEFTTGAIDYEKINDRGVFYQIIGSTKNEEMNLDQYLQQKLSGGLFLYKLTSTQVKVGRFNISIEAEATAGKLLPFFYKIMKQFYILDITENASIHDPAETIRCAEVILDTGSSIKGVSELKEKLDTFIDGE